MSQKCCFCCAARARRGVYSGGVRVRGACREGIQGGYTGWVLGRAIPVYYPAGCCEEPTLTAKRAPEAPVGLEWVVRVGGDYGVWGRRRGRSYPHPPGPVGPPGPSLGYDLRMPPHSQRARYHLIPYKVSQNRRVSLKYVHKASHTPCFQNGLQKSPLDFLEIPFWPVFSHKELMAPFRPNPDFTVKMTKCR